MSGSHNHSGGSSGAHSHGESSSGSPLGLIMMIIFGFGIVYMIASSIQLGKYIYEQLHGGLAHRTAGSWGSMYLNMGWGLIWAVTALLAFLSLGLIPVFRRKGGLVVLIGVSAATLAFVFGIGVATHFGNKVGVSPW